MVFLGVNKVFIKKKQANANAQLDIITIRELSAANTVQYLWFFFIVEFQVVVGKRNNSPGSQHFQFLAYTHFRCTGDPLS